MIKSIGIHSARQGKPIRRNSIHPGPVDTPILAHYRSGTPDEVDAFNQSILDMVPRQRTRAWHIELCAPGLFHLQGP
jgi:NAD(P)-dependent dehydrogenase (short-subunit alcohol dehydrogenase family)